MHPLATRFLRIVLLAWLGWLLLGNLLVNSALGPQLINRTPEAFRIDWSHGLTVWPGQAWLWDVEIHGQLRRIQWSAQAQRAGGRLALLPLLVRQLRFPGIDASQVQARFDRVEHDRLPPPARPGGWTLRFDAIASNSVRSVRAGDLALSGDGVARLAIVKQLRGGALEIRPSTGAMAAVQLRHGDEVVLRDGQLDARFALAAHRRERAPGLARLGLADAHLHLTGSTAGLAIAIDEQGRWQTRRDRADADGGAPASGRLALDLGLREGALVPGGRLELSVPLAAQAAGEQWSATGRVGVRVEPEAIALELHLPPPPGDGGRLDAALAIAGRALPFACIAPAPADAALGPTCSVDRALKDQLARVAGSIDLRWHFGTLHWLQPLLLRAPWLKLDGAGEVQARLQVADGQLAPGSELEVPALATRIDLLDNRIVGSAHAKARIVDGDGGRRMELALAVDRFAMFPQDSPAQAYVEGRDLRLDLAASGELATLHDALTGHLRFSDAQVPDLSVYNRYLTGASVRLLGGRGTLAGDLRIDADGEIGPGRLQLAAVDAGLRLGEIEIAGDLDVDTRLQRAQLERRRFTLDGSTLRLSRVRAVDRERAAGADWWARLELVRGELDWGHPLALDARLQASARDVSLLLGLFGPLREFPRWTLRLADAGEARLEGRVRMADGAVALDPIRAGNERFDVQLRLRLAEHAPQGDLLLAMGRLRAGLELAGGKRRWHLRRASDWFHGRTLPTAARNGDRNGDGGS